MGRRMTNLHQPQILFQLDGTVPLATVGYPLTDTVVYLQNDNTIGAGAAKSWHRIECHGARTVEIYGASKVVDKGGALIVGLCQLRVVAAGIPVDLGFGAPIFTTVSPANWADNNQYRELPLEVWPSMIDNATGSEGSVQRTPNLTTGGMARVSLLLAKTVANNDTAHFRFKIAERQSALHTTTEASGLGRGPAPNIENTDVIYLAIGLHTTATTGNFTTTLVESKIVAVCRK